MSELSFFNKLGSTNSKEVLELLVNTQANLVLKIHDKHFKTKVIRKKSDREYSIYKFNLNDYSNEAVVCSFEIKSEKYFFRSTLRATAAELLIVEPEDLFQLQRRNDFRITITPNLAYSCTVTRVNSQKVKLKAELRDMSLGGCLISLANADKLEVPKDSEIEILLNMYEFEGPIVSIAKHVRFIGSNNSLQLGLQYLNPEADFLSEFQSLLMHLDRIQRGKTMD